MTIVLRGDYQVPVVHKVYDEWKRGAQSVCIVMPTGAGKGSVIAWMHEQHDGASCIVTHRNELVLDLSLRLAKLGVRHNIIAAESAIRYIARAHVEEYGRCFYTPGARVAVASIDTLVRARGLESWAAQVTLVTIDEVHHLARDWQRADDGTLIPKPNKWGRGVELFRNPHLRMLGATATPVRSDGKGLGRHADGYMDVIVEGPPMRWLIDEGYLNDYDLICPPSDMRPPEAKPGASGDWSTTQLRQAAQKSHIVGDIVQHYLRHAAGKLHATFSTDVETAKDITAQFNAAGVPAELLTGATDVTVRRNILKRFASRQILELVTVDIISEGFDLDIIEAASAGRPSASEGLVKQQFGRIVRPAMTPLYKAAQSRRDRLDAIAAGPKPRALMLDHVGNYAAYGGEGRHGLPDKPCIHTLDRRDKRAKSDASPTPIRVCTACLRPFERIYRECPHCGEPVPLPASRTSPPVVDGDLGLLDAETLERLRGGVIDTSGAGWGMEQWRLTQAHVPPLGIAAGLKRFGADQTAQTALRESLERWGGVQLARGLTDVQMQRLAYHTWGIDVLSAQALRAADADALRERVDRAVTLG